MQVVSTDHSGREITFRIKGDLKGEAVAELERLWREELGGQSKSMCIDLRCAREIDPPGRRGLCEMFGTGIEIRVPVRRREKQT